MKVGDSMFFDFFVNKNINYEDDEYKVLDLDIMQQYNVDKLSSRFNIMMKNIKGNQYKYNDIPYKNIAYSYEPRYEQKTNRKSDPTYKKAVERVETKEELEVAFEALGNIFDNNLAYLEKVIFIDSFILKRGRDVTTMKLNIGTTKYRNIRNSIVIKFALGLGWDL